MDDGHPENRPGAAARTPGPSPRARTASLAVTGLVLLLFGTPLRVLWMDASGSWWLGYLLWLAAIVAVAVTARPGR